MAMFSNNKNAILILALMILVNGIRFIVEYNTSMSYESMWLSIGMATFAICLYVFRDEKKGWLHHNSLDSVFIIIISIYIVHFFEYILLMIGGQNTIPYFELFDKSMVNSSVIASSTAIISFILGSMCVKIRMKQEPEEVFSCDIGRKLEIAQILCFIVFFVSTDKRYFFGGYGSVELTTISYVSQQLVQACFFAIIANKLKTSFCNSFKSYIREFSLPFYITNSFYLLLVMMSGDRGPIIFLATPFTFAYFILMRKKFSYKKFVIVGVVGILLMNFLGAIRSLGEGEVNSKRFEEGLERTQNRFDGKVFFGAFSELSGSIKAYNIIYSYSENDGKIYGIGLFDQSIGIVPGLRFILYPIVGINAKEFGTAYISTRLLQEDHGMGTTCIGDVYFNVGFFGVILLFVLGGYAIRYLNLQLYNRDTHYFWLILGIGYVSYAIYIGRGSFFSPFNVCGYAWMIYFLLTQTSKKKIIKNEHRIHSKMITIGTLIKR